MELSISLYYTWLCGEWGSCWWSGVSPPPIIPDYVENEVAADGAEYLPLYLLEAEQHGIHSSSPRTIKSTHERWRALIFSFPKVLIHSSILRKYLHLLSTFSFFIFSTFYDKRYLQTWERWYCNFPKIFKFENLKIIGRLFKIKYHEQMFDSWNKMKLTNCWISNCVSIIRSRQDWDIWRIFFRKRHFDWLIDWLIR